MLIQHLPIAPEERGNIAGGAAGQGVTPGDQSPIEQNRGAVARATCDGFAYHHQAAFRYAVGIDPFPSPCVPTARMVCWLL